MKNLVSIIIRTRNEERWISQCLRAVMNQAYKNFEVIIVDNESNDKTLEKAKQFKIAKIINCAKYLPGKALNLGIKASKGEYVACLSGHCVPVDEKWLGNLIGNFDSGKVAGVYGRQEPMEFTSDLDKRDLALIFGLDRKVQTKDSFFHNANSMIRKDVWNKMPFNEMVTNIEDRAWANEALNRNYKIIYEPEASVYHYHGIHQDGDRERCRSVVRILEDIHSGYKYKSIDIDRLNTVAIIPVRGNVPTLNNKSLLAYTIERAHQSRYIKKVVVSTDDMKLARLAKSLGAEVPFVREKKFSGDKVNISQVLQYSLGRIEEQKIFPDLVVSLEITFPFRPRHLLDSMIAQLTQNGLDSIVATRRENKGIWKEKEGEIVQMDEGLTPREFKDPTFVELRGLGCVTHPEFVRQGSLFGEKMGMYELKDPYSHIEVRNSDDIKMASYLIKGLFRS